MIIRTVTEKDAHELLEIYRPYVEDTAITFEYDVPSVEEFSDRIRRISANYPYIAAVENGKIAGYAYAGIFKNRAAYDWSVEVTVYVKKGLHRKGIGAKLYSALEKLLAAQHITNLYACVAYPEKEDEYLTFDSVKFHEKMGYAIIGTFHRCALTVAVSSANAASDIIDAARAAADIPARILEIFICFSSIFVNNF
jgi:L-amino acid N-acyltransferase YncA